MIAYCHYLNTSQDTAELDRRTTTAVESLLRLGNSPSPSPQSDQWRPPSPASSVVSGGPDHQATPPRATASNSPKATPLSMTTPMMQIVSIVV